MRIVAVGSSSTTGLWVLSPDATYPEVMRCELARLRPTTRVEVINSGRIGETITGSIARFQRDVTAYSPDLVVWRLGTNDVAWGGSGAACRIGSRSVRMLKANDADVILMDLQYAPLVLASPQHSSMQAIIADVARQEHVGLFPRLGLMRRSIDAGLPAGAPISWDGLRNSAAGYDCVGRALAAGHSRWRALRPATIYAAAAVFPGHSRATMKSRRPDPRQAGTAHHSHDSFPLVK